MTVQNVSCFSEVKFIETDTCTQNAKDLKNYTELSVLYQKAKTNDYDDYKVAWFSMNAAGSCAGTACHAGFHGRPPPSQILNVIRWDAMAKCSFSAEFQTSFSEWMLDPERSLWKDALHRMAILRNDAGKPLATLWLNPSKTPSVPLVHFCIAGPRFLTEKSKMLENAEPIYETCGDFNKTYVGAHLKYNKASGIVLQTGHLGQNPAMATGVPKRFIDKPPVFDVGKTYTIYVNDDFMGPSYKWVKKPTFPKEYSDCWDLVVAEQEKK